MLFEIVKSIALIICHIYAFGLGVSRVLEKFSRENPENSL